MSQRSHKPFINSYLIIEWSIFTAKGSVSEPGPNELNSLRRSTMKIGLFGQSGIAAILVFASLSFSSQLQAQFTPAPAASALSIPESQWLKPEALLHQQQIKGAEKPLILQVGSRMLFAQAHIPGSEYIGPGSTIAKLSRW